MASSPSDITAGLLKKLRDIGHERQAVDQAKVMMQLLIGMYTLQQKGIGKPGVDALITELMIILGQQPSTATAINQKETIQELARKIDVALIDVMPTMIDEQVEIARILAEYGITKETYQGQYNTAIGEYFKDEQFFGKKQAELFIGEGLTAVEKTKYLAAIYRQDSADQNQVFCTLAGKSPATFVGIDEAIFNDFSIHYAITCYEELYGVPYDAAEAVQEGSHIEFAQKLLAQEFPIVNRSNDDTTLLQALIDIDRQPAAKLEEELQAKQKEKTTLTVVDIAMYRDELRQAKLQEFLGVSASDPLTPRYKLLLRKLADSKDLYDRIQALNTIGAADDVHTRDKRKKIEADYLAKQYIRTKLTHVDGLVAEHGDIAITQQLQQEILRLHHERKTFEAPSEEETIFALRSQQLAVIDLHCKDKGKDATAQVQAIAKDYQIQQRLRDHYVQLVEQAATNKVELLAFKLNISLAEASAQKEKFFTLIGGRESLAALQDEFIQKYLTLKPVREYETPVNIKNEVSHEILKHFNQQHKALLQREIIKNRLAGKTITSDGETIDPELPFFRDATCLHAYEAEFNANMQQQFITAIEQDATFRQRVISGLNRRGVLDPGVAIAEYNFHSPKEKLLNEKKRELYLGLRTIEHDINDKIKKGTPTDDEVIAREIDALANKIGEFELDSRFNRIVAGWEREIMARLKTKDLVLPEPILTEYLHGVNHALTQLASSEKFIELTKILEPLLNLAPSDMSTADSATLQGKHRYQLVEKLAHKFGIDSFLATNVDTDMAYMEDMNHMLKTIAGQTALATPIQPTTPSTENAWSSVMMIWTPVGSIPVPSFKTIKRFNGINDLQAWESIGRDFNSLFADGQYDNLTEVGKKIARKFIGIFPYIEIGAKVLASPQKKESTPINTAAGKVNVADKILPALLGGEATGYMHWLAQKLFSIPEHTDASIGGVVDELVNKYIADGKLSLELSVFDTLQVMHDIFQKLNIPKGIDQELDASITALNAAYTTWIKNSVVLQEQIQELTRLQAIAVAIDPQRETKINLIQQKITTLRDANLAIAETSIAKFVTTKPSAIQDPTLTRVLWQVGAQARQLSSAIWSQNVLASAYNNIVKLRVPLFSTPLSNPEFKSSIEALRAQHDRLAARQNAGEAITKEEQATFTSTMSKMMTFIGGQVASLVNATETKVGELVDGKINTEIESLAYNNTTASLVAHLTVLKTMDSNFASDLTRNGTEKIQIGATKRVKISSTNVSNSFGEQLSQGFKKIAELLKRLFSRDATQKLSPAVLVAAPVGNLVTSSDIGVEVPINPATDAHQREVNRNILKFEQAKQDFYGEYEKLLAIEANMQDLPSICKYYTAYVAAKEKCVTKFAEMKNFGGQLTEIANTTSLVPHTFIYNQQTMLLTEINSEINGAVEKLNNTIISPLQLKVQSYNELKMLQEAISAKSVALQASLAKLEQQAAMFLALIKNQSAMPKKQEETVDFYIHQCQQLKESIQETTKEISSLQDQVNDTEPRKTIITNLAQEFLTQATQLESDLSELHKNDTEFKLYEAIFAIDKEKVKACVAQLPIEQQPQIVYDALFYATKHNKHEVLATLLAAGKIDINSKDKNGLTLLQRAIAFSSTTTTLETLINIGADPFVKDAAGKLAIEKVKPMPGSNIESIIKGYQKDYADSKLEVVAKNLWDNDYEKILNVRRELQFYEKRLTELHTLLSASGSDGNNQGLQQQLVYLKQALNERLTQIPKEYTIDARTTNLRIQNQTRFTEYFEGFKTQVLGLCEPVAKYLPKTLS